jgi:hypothetical protein
LSRDGSISFVWGDGEHRFRLAIGQLRELQEKTNTGPAEVLRRVSSGLWRVDDVRETVRLGLIGGGMAPGEAYKLVQRYVDERPLRESVQPAQAILLAALVGAPDEPVGKAAAAEAETETTQVGASPSPPSTGSGSLSDSPPSKLMN